MTLQSLVASIVAFFEHPISILLVILIFAVYLTIKITSWKKDIEHGQKDLGKDQKGVTQSIEKLEQALTSFMIEIREDVKKIFRLVPPAPVETDSPLRLSNLGEEIAEEIKIKDWIAEYEKKLHDTAQGKNPYEIQELCFTYARERLPGELKRRGEPEDIEELMKMSAFQHGLKLNQVLQVAGVVLRDEVLKLLDIEMPPDKPSEG